MNTWTEILTENEAQARDVLETERCKFCGVILGDHYDVLNVWVPCSKKMGDQ